MLIVEALETSICTALLEVPHPCNLSRLRVNCSSRQACSFVFILKSSFSSSE